MGTAFFAGLRRGELLGLRWEDVDLSGSRIRVERAYHPETDSYGPPKSKAGKRMVGLPRILIPYLAALDNTEGLVFPDPRGGPMEYHRLQRRAVAAWKRAGLEPIASTSAGTPTPR